MIKFDAILLLAGSGERCGLGYNKVLHFVNKKPIFMYSLEKFLECENCENIIIACQRGDYEAIEKICNDLSSKIKIVLGGLTRQESVYNSLREVKNEYVLIHDGARPNVCLEDIYKVSCELENSDVVTLATKVKEAVRKMSSNEAIDRSDLVLIKTPQGVKRNDLLISLEKAEKENKKFYDDVSAIEYYLKKSPMVVWGKESNLKITTKDDLLKFELLVNKNMNYRIGHSKDTHQLIVGGKMIIGGVSIASELGIKAHSDGDVLYHAITEAIIGALGKGDIGHYFPDNDMKYKNISSSFFMEKAKEMLDQEGYEISNLDCIIYIEKPMMFPYLDLMKENISNLLNVSLDKVNVKATRGEKVGPIGESKAVASEAVILIKGWK